MLSRPGEVQSAYVTADNLPAVITILGGSAVRRHLSFFSWSYSGTPTGGSLSVTVNGVEKIGFDITTGGPGVLSVNVPGLVDAPMAVTLAAGGSGVVGKLYAEFF